MFMLHVYIYAALCCFAVIKEFVNFQVLSIAVIENK